MLGFAALGEVALAEVPSDQGIFPTIALGSDSAYYDAASTDAPVFDALVNDEPGIW